MRKTDTYPQALAVGHQAAKSKATRDKFVSAAIRIIKADGFAAASSSRIAREAGVTWGAAQHHFGNKDAILQEVLERSHQVFRQTLDDPGFVVGRPAERVRRYVSAAWDHYSGDLFMAALEILLAWRGHAGSPSDQFFRHSRADHLGITRRIFHDSPASDAKLHEAIYCVHCMFSGLLVESTLERGNFHAGPYIGHLEKLVHNLLYP